MYFKLDNIASSSRHVNHSTIQLQHIVYCIYLFELHYLFDINPLEMVVVNPLDAGKLMANYIQSCIIDPHTTISIIK